MIKDYSDNNLKKKETKIKDFESIYKELQESMLHIEKLKEDNQIAKQDIYQHEFHYRIHLIYRQGAMKNAGLKDKEFGSLSIGVKPEELPESSLSRTLSDTVTLPPDSPTRIESQEFFRNKEINIQNPEVDQNEHIKILNDRIKKIDEETKEIYLRKDVINGITDTKEKRIYKYLYDKQRYSL
jgi:hypothetical protein